MQRHNLQETARRVTKHEYLRLESPRDAVMMASIDLGCPTVLNTTRIKVILNVGLY